MNLRLCAFSSALMMGSSLSIAADCELRREYLQEVSNRQASGENIENFHARWYVRLSGEEQPASTDGCDRWRRRELMAISGAIGNFDEARSMARQLLLEAITCEQRLVAANNFIAKVLSSFARSLTVEQKAECRVGALMGLELCVEKRAMLADPAQHLMLSYVVPLLHIVASTEHDDVRREAQLREVLAFIDEAIAVSAGDFASDRKRVLSDLIMMEFATDDVEALRALMDQLGDGTNGKAMTAMTLASRRGIEPPSPMSRYLVEIVEACSYPGLRMQLLSLQSMNSMHRLVDQNAPRDQVMGHIALQERLLSSVRTCRDLLQGDPASLDYLGIDRATLDLQEANAIHEVYEKHCWFLRDAAAARPFGELLIALFPNDSRADAVRREMAHDRQ